MKNNPKIVIFTGTRAEYGLLKYVIKSVQFSKKLELKLFVSSSHLSNKFGNTISEIKSDKIIMTNNTYLIGCYTGAINDKTY